MCLNPTIYKNLFVVEINCVNFTIVCIVHRASFFKINRKNKSIKNYTYTLTNLIVAVRKVFLLLLQRS